jgi:hypothetical protein
MSTQRGQLLGNPQPSLASYRGVQMNSPRQKRLHNYEAGWLALLLRMGVADEQKLREAQGRVAQAATDEMNVRRERRRRSREQRRDRRSEG